MAGHQRPAGRAHSEPRRAARPAGEAGSVQPRAERPDHRAEPPRAARPHPVGELRPAALPAEAPHAEGSARPADAAVSGGLPGLHRGSAQRAARQAPHAAWPGDRAAGASRAARHAAAVQAWRAAAPGARTARAASAAGVGPAAERVRPARQAVPAHAAGRAVLLLAAAGAVARVDRHLRRRGPVRPGIRPRRRPARLAKGRGPAGQSRPATNVSCASLFPSLCFNVRVSGRFRPEPPMKRKRRESGKGSRAAAF